MFPPFICAVSMRAPVRIHFRFTCLFGSVAQKQSENQVKRGFLELVINEMTLRQRQETNITSVTIFRSCLVLILVAHKTGNMAAADDAVMSMTARIIAHLQQQPIYDQLLKAAQVRMKGHTIKLCKSNINPTGSNFINM